MPKKSFLVKAINPIWDISLQHLYDDLGSFDTKEEALKKRRLAQSLGYIKVCIKKREIK